jgi:hypothetical protein
MMAAHPFTREVERVIVDGAEALYKLGYGKTAWYVEQVLEEQRRARAYREAKQVS